LPLVTGGAEAVLGAFAFLALAYAGFVYGAYLEMRGLSALAEVGGVPLLARAGRWVFVGALLLVVLVGILVMFVGYVMVLVGLWRGPSPKLGPDDNGEIQESAP